VTGEKYEKTEVQKKEERRGSKKLGALKRKKQENEEENRGGKQCTWGGNMQFSNPSRAKVHDAEEKVFEGGGHKGRA